MDQRAGRSARTRTRMRGRARGRASPLDSAFHGRALLGPRRGGRGVAMALVASLLSIGTVVLVPPLAEAAFPGQNGPIVFVGGGFCPGRYHHGTNGWSNGAQLLELQAGHRRPVQLTCTAGRVAHPFVSPDGSEVVFSSTQHGGPGQLFTIPLGSSHLPVQATLVSDPPAIGADDDYPSWSPSGDGTIVFQRTEPGGVPQLYIENVADPTAATPVFPTPTGSADTQPVFDPFDANTVTFVRSVGGHTHIFSYDMASKTLTDLSAAGNGGGTGNDSKPDYSPAPSGGQIVFQSDRACGKTQLYTMAVDGTQQVPVFQTLNGGMPTGTQMCTSASSDPVFSPQGDAIAYDRQVWGGVDLAFVSLDPPGTAPMAAVRLGYRGNGFGFGSAYDFGSEPNWGLSAGPPADAPETALPVLLPVVGSVVAGTVLLARRRRLRAARG